MFFFELNINNNLAFKAKRLPKVAAALAAAWMRYWHNKIAPKHFRHGAARKYGYQRRKEGYQKRKRKLGSPPALVFTGKARDRLLRMSFFRTFTVGPVAKGRFIAGNEIKYFWMQPKGQPNKPAELTVLSKDEEQDLIDFVRDGVIRELEEKTPTKRYA